LFDKINKKLDKQDPVVVLALGLVCGYYARPLVEKATTPNAENPNGLFTQKNMMIAGAIVAAYLIFKKDDEDDEEEEE